MLRGLILENFKGFGQRQVIPLAPITLIYGANSAGKSSILQSLLLLKQTLSDSTSNNSVLLARGALTDLGGFEELVFRHEVSRLCEVTPLLDLEWVRNRANRYPWPILPNQAPGYNPQLRAGLGCKFGFNERERSIKLIDLPFYWDIANLPLFRLEPTAAVSEKDISAVPGVYRYHERASDSTNWVALGSLEASHTLWSAFLQDFLTEGRTATLSLLYEIRELMPVEPNDWIDNEHIRKALDLDARPRPSAHQAKKRVKELREYFNHCIAMFESFGKDDLLNHAFATDRLVKLQLKNFLPVEFYYPTWAEDDVHGRLDQLMGELGNPPNTSPMVMQMAMDASNLLLKALNNLVNLGPVRDLPSRYYMNDGNHDFAVGASGKGVPALLQASPELVSKVNERLRRLGVGCTLQFHQASDRGFENLFSLRLVDASTGISVSALDVGVGISQLLPIVVQCILARNRLVLVEQPELHLHPGLQAEMGTMFAECIGKRLGNQFLIETHSEHLVLRIQRLIRHRQLRASDVSVLYVKKDDQGSHCIPLRLDDDGDFIDNWPDGFFEEGYNEVFG